MGQIQYQRLWLIFMDIDSTIHIYFFIRHIVPWLMTIRKYDHAILGSRSRSRASIVCPWVSTRGIIHLILTQVCSVGLPQYDQQILSYNYKYGHRHIKCLTLRIYSTSRWTIEIKGYQLCLWTCQPIDSYGICFISIGVMGTSYGYLNIYPWECEVKVEGSVKGHLPYLWTLGNWFT